MTGNQTQTEAPTTEQQFNKDIPPVLTDCGNPIGYIENDPDYPDEVGKIWLRNTWVDVAKARELRDWLNKVIP
jgi:hypothetical protein